MRCCACGKEWHVPTEGGIQYLVIMGVRYYYCGAGKCREKISDSVRGPHQGGGYTPNTQ